MFEPRFLRVFELVLSGVRHSRVDAGSLYVGV